MALSAGTINTMRSIGLTSARREDGQPAYPPFPYAILRNATVALAKVLAMSGMGARLIQALQETERSGHFIHPKTANFQLLMLAVYEDALNTPHLANPMSGGNDDDGGVAHVELAQQLGEYFSTSPRLFLNAAD